MTPGNNGHFGAAVLPNADNCVIQPMAPLAVNNYPAVTSNGNSITNNNTESQGIVDLRNKLRGKACSLMVKLKSHTHSDQYQQALHLFNMTTTSDDFRSTITSGLVKESLEDSIFIQNSTGTAKNCLLVVTRNRHHRVSVVLGKKSGTADVSSNNPAPVTDNKNSQNNGNKTTNRELAPICFNIDHRLMAESASSSTSDSRASHTSG